MSLISPNLISADHIPERLPTAVEDAFNSYLHDLVIAALLLLISHHFVAAEVGGMAKKIRETSRAPRPRQRDSLIFACPLGCIECRLEPFDIRLGQLLVLF